MNLCERGNESSTGLGEGSVFFLVTSDLAQRKYGAFSDISFSSEQCIEGRPDICIIENHGGAFSQGIPIAEYSPIFGNMMSGSGFQCAVAALMLRNQIAYASPVRAVPEVLTGIAKITPMNIREIYCIKYDYKQQKCCVKLKK
jgi:hypothetical protein